MKKYQINVSYKDKRYSPLSLLYSSYFHDNKSIEVPENDEDFSYPLLVIAKSREDEKNAYLDFGYLCFIKETIGDEETFRFDESWNSTISFSYETLEGNCPLDYLKDFTSSNVSIDLYFMEEVLQYIENISKNNPAVFNYYIENLDNLSKSRYSFHRVSNDVSNKIFIENLIRLTTTNLIEIEKLITSDNFEVLKNIMNTKDSILEKGKKLAKVINIPKFALDYMKANNLFAAQDTIRGIANDFDGNILNIIFDLFDSYGEFEKFNKLKWDEKTSQKINFLENCYFLLKEGYKITPLLNYLLRQSMFYSDKNVHFAFPFSKTKELVDYINLCKKNNFSIEKFPQDLERTHDITVMNSEELGDTSKNEAFTKAIKDNYYIDNLEIDDFVFLVPESIEDLVLEGNKLHHCIGSYTDNIIENISHIYFMRFKDNPSESYVTIELSPKTHDLLEFKGNYNKEPTEPEVIKAINKFVKEIKKMAIKVETIIEDEEK